MYLSFDEMVFIICAVIIAQVAMFFGSRILKKIHELRIRRRAKLTREMMAEIKKQELEELLNEK